MRTTAVLNPMWKSVVISLDDILTLTLLRDSLRMELTAYKHRSFREWEQMLETVDRILKQVS